jgi:hypothetical protein
MPDSSTALPAALGRPATRALEAAGHRTIQELDGASERELLALHGVGPRAIKVLREHAAQLVP